MSTPIVRRIRGIAGTALDAIVHGSSLARNRAVRARGRIGSRWDAHPGDGAFGFLGDPRAWVQPGDRREYPGDEHLGWDLLRRWAEAGVCCTIGDFTRIVRHSVQPIDDPQNSPHTLMDAEDLAIDFARLYPARTLEHRPRYRMGRGCPYHRYRAGALTGACRWTSEFRLESLPRDHLRDIFASFEACADTPAARCDTVVEPPVLFVTREGDESRNLFHATTDFLNAFQSVLMAGVDRLDLGVVLLDNAPAAPFDPLWRRVFAPRYGVRRVADFGGRRVRFRRAIFSPPGYQSCCYAFLTRESPQRSRVGLLEAFSALVLRAHGIDPARRRAPGPLRATLVSRRPYPGRTAVDRQIANERACLDAIGSIDGVDPRAVDFARYPIEEQLRIASESDLLVGTHGAALTHLLWTPPRAGIVELEPGGGRGWRCYRNLATWTGRPYATVTRDERASARGSEVTIDPARLAAAVRGLATAVRADT